MHCVQKEQWENSDFSSDCHLSPSPFVHPFAFSAPQFSLPNATCYLHLYLPLLSLLSCSFSILIKSLTCTWLKWLKRTWHISGISLMTQAVCRGGGGTAANKLVILTIMMTLERALSLSTAWFECASISLNSECNSKSTAFLTQSSAALSLTL